VSVGAVALVSCTTKDAPGSRCGAGTRLEGDVCVVASGGNGDGGVSADGGGTPSPGSDVAAHGTNGDDAGTPGHGTPGDAGAHVDRPRFPSVGRWLVYGNGSDVMAVDAATLPPASPMKVNGVSPGYSALTAWSPDGRFLAWTNVLGGAQLADFGGPTPTGAVIAYAPAATSSYGAALAWSPDARRLAVASGGSVSVFDPTEAAPIPQSVDQDVTVWQLEWSPDGSSFAYVVWDQKARMGEIKLVRVTAGVAGTPESLTPPSSAQGSVAWTAAGRLAFAAGSTLHLLDPKSGTTVDLLSSDPDAIDSISWGPGDGALSFTGGTSVVRVDGVTPGAAVASAPGLLAGPLTYYPDPEGRSPDGAWNAGISGGFGGKFAVFPGGAGTALTPVTIDGISSPTSTVWSPDSKWLSVGDKTTGGEWLVRPDTGLAYFAGTTKTSRAFSPDSKVFAAGASLMDVTGAVPGTPQVLMGVSASAALASAWAPTSDKLAYDTGSSVWIAHVDGVAAAVPIEVGRSSSATQYHFLTWQP
jgi:hypothetical protein